VWDREVFLESGSPDTYERGDTFMDNGFKDLDFYLAPAGQGIDQAIAASTSTDWNLEHIFHSVPANGNYELWASLAGGEFTTVDYAKRGGQEQTREAKEVITTATGTSMRLTTAYGIPLSAHQ
jgi:hypothetical protein